MAVYSVHLLGLLKMFAVGLTGNAIPMRCLYSLWFPTILNATANRRPSVDNATGSEIVAAAPGGRCIRTNKSTGASRVVPALAAVDCYINIALRQ